MICAGFGMRDRCPRTDLERAFEAALQAAHIDRASVALLATLSSKVALLTPFAKALGLRIETLSLAELQRAELHTLTASTLVFARFGVGSVAEACALRVAQRTGPARLLGPRQNAGSASCALAISEGTT